MDNNLDFTVALENEFYSVVDNNDFLDKDAESIYEHLNSKMKFIPFCDYLKRYILRKLNHTTDISKTDLKFYQNYIIKSFNENLTPKSFSETTTKTSVITKNWLTQTSVNRNVIFLLGFGLNMSVGEVSEFLVNVQKEHDFNFKNPFEIVCWYCYSHNLKYPDFVRIMNAYNNSSKNAETYCLDSTIAIRDLFYKIDSEDDLMTCLLNIKAEHKGKYFSSTARGAFENLYAAVRQIIAGQYSDDEYDSANKRANEYMEKINNSDKLSMEEKALRASAIRQSAKKYCADDISEADVEKCLCCGIPFDEKGNLMKYSYSTLATQFHNKRMSRQHLRDILIGKTDVDRFDLITLNFYIHAMSDEANNKRRYISFVESTNDILKKCYMGELYVANPYECFLLMCILSDCPMGTYSDVLELSYQRA